MAPERAALGYGWGFFFLLFLILFFKNNSASLGTEEFIFPLVKRRDFLDSNVSFLFPGMQPCFASFSENRTHVFVLELTSSSLSSEPVGPLARPWEGGGGEGGGSCCPRWLKR